MFLTNLREDQKSKRQKGRISTHKIDPNIIKLFAQQVDDLAFKQNLQQLEQKLGLHQIDQTSQTFKDLKHYLQTLLGYPNTSLAKLHRASHRLGNFDRQRTQDQKEISRESHKSQIIIQLQNCPCCGLVRQEEQLKLCSNSMKDIAVVGISTYMFFRTMRNLLYFLLLALIVFGVFAFATNIKCADLWNDELKGMSFNNLLRISLNPKVYLAVDQVDYYADLLIWQVWLGVVLVVLHMGAYVLMEYIQVTDIREVEYLNKSASDYSIVLKDVPADVTKEQVQHQINQLMGYTAEGNQQFPNPFHIVKINVGTPLSISSQIQYQQKTQLLQLQQKHNEYQQQIASWIKQLCTQDQFFTPAQNRRRIQQQYLQNKQKILQKHRVIAEHVKTLYKNRKNKTLTDCYVTFQSTAGKDRVLDSVDYTAFMKFFRYLTLFIYQKTVAMKFGRENQEYKVKIEQASQPEDVIWKNSGIKTTGLFIRKCITYLITLVVLGMSFAAVYGLSNIQVSNQSNRYISFLISLCITVFNFIIAFILRILTVYELNATQTQYQSSFAIKVILAQLINTILIPILVNRFLKKAFYLYATSGLSQDIFLLSLTLSFIDPLLKIFDPYYYISKYVMVWYYSRPDKKFFIDQVEFNRIYELVLYQSGVQYIYVISLYLWTCFFMSLQPIIILFSIAGFVLNYWAQKYYLFHRSKRPVPGTRILYDTMVQFVYAGGLFYALGSLTFVNLLPEDLFGKRLKFGLIANLIAVGLSAISLFIPYSYLYSLWFPTSYKQENQLFSQNRLFLPSQYDRMNPATSQQAIDQYLKYINKRKEQIKHNHTSQSQIGRILQTLTNQARNNYHHSFEEMNPLYYFTSVGRQIDQLFNPQIETLRPNVIQNFLFGDMVQERAEQMVGALGKMFGDSSDSGNKEDKWLIKEEEDDKEVHGVLEKVKSYVTGSGKGKTNKRSLNIHPQMSQQRMANNDNEDFGGQITLKKTEEKDFEQNPFEIMKHFFNSNTKNPLQNPLNYSSSPYNPAALEEFKKTSNDLRTKSIAQANTKQSYRKVSELMGSVKKGLIKKIQEKDYGNDEK